MRPFSSIYLVLTDEHSPSFRVTPGGGVVLTADTDPTRIGSCDIHFGSVAQARKWLATAQASIAEVAPADQVTL